MIVSSETRTVFDPSTRKQLRQLVVSYINAQGGISYLTYTLPEEQQYVWKYTVPNSQNVCRDFMSWDFRPVQKVSQKGPLPVQRIHEILLDLADTNPQINTIYDLYTPDISFCDIEVNVDDSGFPDAETAPNEVNTISWVNKDLVIVYGRTKLSQAQIANIQKRIDEHCKKFKTRYTFTYLYFEHEYELLTSFFRDLVHPAACVTGWNFFGYDWPYLCKRAEKLGIDIRYLSPTGSWMQYSVQSKQDFRISLPMHKLMYDYMEIYIKWDKSINPKESNKLDWVGEKAVGVKKVHHQLGFKDMWEQQPEDYVFYNAVDSILVAEIDKKLKTSATFYSLVNLLHIDALTAFSPVRSLETVQCEFLYKQKRIFPVSEKKKGQANDGYEGAFVFEPKPGIYRNVIALDYASLYPSTIRQFNMSPDTFIKKDKNFNQTGSVIKAASGAIYRNDIEGFLPQILTYYFNKRKSFKKEMQEAISEKYELEKIYEKRFKTVFANE